MKVLIVLVLVMGLSLGALGLGWFGMVSDTGPTFRTVAAGEGDVVVSIAATGPLAPVQTVDVGTLVNGQIRRLGSDPQDVTKSIDSGTVVAAGDVLAELDDALYRAAVNEAQADLKRVEAEKAKAAVKLNQAERSWKRAQELRRTAAISDAEFDVQQAAHEEAQAEMQVAEAGVLQAQAALEHAKINLNYATIRAPIGGVVIARRVDVGQAVGITGSGLGLFLLATDLAKLEVWASVNEADIGRIHVDQPVTFTVDTYPDRIFHGKVARIRLDANLAHNVVTYTVVIDADNPEGVLRPYMTANLQFEIARRAGVVTVPNQALRWRPPEDLVTVEGKTVLAALKSEKPAGDTAMPGDSTGAGGTRPGVVWVEAPEGKVRPVKIEVGLSDGAVSELVSGELAAGAKLVVGYERAKRTLDFSSAFVPKRENSWNEASGGG